ncbi:hypothetical protein CHELA1G11_12662 [Hyphomicrobiales bacterium]|nr:hypothetical protein CHELA1G2_11645 [Hyphomicrobiales bacterium]CAH1666249.1 hypothetical protein CHELA1G11_12662 [Hyphomicrobiales bacterium]
MREGPAVAPTLRGLAERERSQVWDDRHQHGKSQPIPAGLLCFPGIDRLAAGFRSSAPPC